MTDEGTDGGSDLSRPRKQLALKAKFEDTVRTEYQLDLPLRSFNLLSYFGPYL